MTDEIILNTRILIMTIFLLLLVLPAAAVERPFALKGKGTVAFITDEAGNVIGGNLAASGTATQLGLWTRSAALSFTANPDDPNLILTSCC